MTTAPPVPNRVAAQFDLAATETRPQLGSGERHRRRAERHKLVRQQVAVVVIMLLVLVITLVVLGLQWLNSGSRPGSSSSSLGRAATTTVTGEPI
jgi:hypothetical protein